MRDTLLLDRRSFNMICLRPLKLVTCYLRTRTAPNVRSENRLSSKSVRQIKNRVPEIPGQLEPMILSYSKSQ